MLAKKMTLYYFKGDRTEIQKGINASPFVELMGAQSAGMGFVCESEESDRLFGEFGSALTFCVRMDQKKVPSSAVKNELAKRVAAKEQECGYKLGKKLIAEIKQEVIDGLTAKALAQTNHVRGWFDFQSGLLTIADTSLGKIDDILSLLIKQCEGLEITRIQPGEISTVLTDWVIHEGGTLPPGLCLEDKAKFVLGDSGKASVSSVNLTETRFAQLLEPGSSVVEVGLTVQDKFSVVINENLQFKSIKHLNLDNESSSAETPDSHEAELAADAFLNAQSGEYLLNFFLGVFADDKQAAAA